MKRIVLILFGTLLVFSSHSQNKNLRVERNISKYFVDTLYSQIDFCYSNTSDSVYILWIEKDNVDSLSNFKKIRKHFYNTKGDFSLIQIIWDGNGRTARLMEKWFLIEKIGQIATSVQLEKNYYNKIKNYYSNIKKLGLEYEDLDYSKSLDFLLMTVNGINDVK